MEHSRDQARGTRRDQELDRREPEVQPIRTAVADSVLALQRSVGNHAVCALLARSPDTAKPEEKDKAEGAEASGSRATLPGIGTILLTSVSFTGQPASGGEGSGSRARDRDAGKATIREIAVTSKAGDHSPKLHKAVIDGNPMEVEVIVRAAGGKSTLTLKLKSTIVSSLNMTGQAGDLTESWVLNFESMEHKFEGDSGE